MTAQQKTMLVAIDEVTSTFDRDVRVFAGDRLGSAVEIVSIRV